MLFPEIRTKIAELTLRVVHCPAGLRTIGPRAGGVTTADLRFGVMQAERAMAVLTLADLLRGTGACRERGLMCMIRPLTCDQEARLQ
jgi:hypothetical protein